MSLEICTWHEKGPSAICRCLDFENRPLKTWTMGSTNSTQPTRAINKRYPWIGFPHPKKLSTWNLQMPPKGKGETWETSTQTTNLNQFLWFSNVRFVGVWSVHAILDLFCFSVHQKVESAKSKTTSPSPSQLAAIEILELPPFLSSIVKWGSEV